MCIFQLIRRYNVFSIWVYYYISFVLSLIGNAGFSFFLLCSMRNVLVCEMMIMVFIASCDISNYKCYVLFCSCVMLFLCIFLILHVVIIRILLRVVWEISSLISLLFCFYFIVSWVLLCNTNDVILIEQ